MADSLHTINQHVVAFSFFMPAEKRGITTPWENTLEVAAAAVLYLTHIGSTSNRANQHFVVSLAS